MRKNLRSLTKLYDLDSGRSCPEVWVRQLAKFDSIPVPCTVEEAEVKHVEEVVERAERTMERVRRKVVTKRHIRKLAPPRPFHFDWRAFMWKSNKGTNMLPK